MQTFLIDWYYIFSPNTKSWLSASGEDGSLRKLVCSTKYSSFLKKILLKDLLPTPQISVQWSLSLWKIPRSRVKESFLHIAILKCNSVLALLMLHWHYLYLGYPTSKAKTVYCSSLWPDQVALHLPGGSRGKESACQCKRCKRRSFDPGLGRFPWKRAGQPTPGFLPGESHGQRSLVGCSP